MGNRHSIRLINFDYKSCGSYFITICTNGDLLGEIKDGVMILNEWGRISELTWFDLINHNRNISLDQFIIMPNHIHGIIVINWAGLEPAPTSITEMVRQFKTFSAKRINQLRGTVGVKFWQRNYYERIIRDYVELNHFRKYIQNNPMTWETDTNNPANKSY